MASDSLYGGKTALEVVEQMRQGDFDQPATVRDFVAGAVRRAAHYFGVEIKVDMTLPEPELAEAFLEASIAAGFAWREDN